MLLVTVWKEERLWLEICWVHPYQILFPDPPVSVVSNFSCCLLCWSNSSCIDCYKDNWTQTSTSLILQTRKWIINSPHLKRTITGNISGHDSFLFTPVVPPTPPIGAAVNWDSNFWLNTHSSLRNIFRDRSTHNHQGYSCNENPPGEQKSTI